MRDPKRIDAMIAAVSEYWHEFPDLRLGQLIDNMQSMTQTAQDLFYIEDDELMKGLGRLPWPAGRLSPGYVPEGDTDAP